MTENQRKKWERLESFNPDKSDAKYPFSARLAKENNWSMSFTTKVIEEYKKFIFLAAEAGHVVSPSETIDKVWHLHLIYTQSYWKDLCEDILGKRIDHTPSNGGRQESEKYSGLRELTLKSYYKFFGTYPPSDIWEDNIPSEYRQESHSPSLVPWQKTMEEYTGLIVLAAGGSLAGIFTIISGLLLPSIPGKTFLLAFIMLIIAGYIIAKIFNAYFSKEVKEDILALESLQKMSAFEVAYLKSNDSRMITNALLARLAGAGAISVNLTNKTLSIAGKNIEKASPLELTVIHLIGENNGSINPISLHARLERSAAFRQVTEYVENLKNQMLTYSDFFNAKWVPIMVATAVSALGVGRTIMGIYHQKPVIYLMILTAISAGIVYYWMKRWSNPLYEHFIPEYFKNLHGSAEALTQNHREDWAVGLYGTGIYNTTFFPLFIPIYGGGIGGGGYSGGSNSSGGCGSGDSTGGDSSGCGGGDSSGCGGGDSGGCGGGCGGCGGGD